MILQPQLFCIIALFCNVQCLYYDQHVYPFDNGSMERKFKYGVVFVVRLLVLGAIQAAGVIGVKVSMLANIKLNGKQNALSLKFYHVVNHRVTT